MVLQKHLSNIFGELVLRATKKRYYFNYGSDLSDMSTNNYWPQAHAMDVLVDAYMRTGKSYYKELFPLWWEGMPKYNFAGKMNPKDPWWNVFC